MAAVNSVDHLYYCWACAMFARLFALFCTLYVSISTGQAQFLGSGEVAVYLKVKSDHSTSALGEMKAELETLMRSVGVTIHWWDPRKDPSTKQTEERRPEANHPEANHPEANRRELVILELRGACEAPHRPIAASQITMPSLGSSAVSDGHILPVSAGDCLALTRIIGNSVAELPAPRRDFIYGRAMARLAAHELYHVLSQRSEHTRTGIAKAEFASADLLTDRLEFEETVVEKNRREANVEIIAPGVAIDNGNEK